jgi:hypothetical protein
MPPLAMSEAELAELAGIALACVDEVTRALAAVPRRGPPPSRAEEAADG